MDVNAIAIIITALIIIIVICLKNEFFKNNEHLSHPCSGTICPEVGGHMHHLSDLSHRN